MINGAARAGGEQERVPKGIITGKDVETRALEGKTICPKTWGDGAGAQHLCLVQNAVSRLVLLPGSGFGVCCQDLYLDSSGCSKNRKGLEGLSSDGWVNVSPWKLWKAVLAVLFELVS